MHLGHDGLGGWFTGHGRYMTLIHCMGRDWFWIALTIGLDLSVVCGYALIALHWRKNERMVPASPAKVALADMKAIFVFCGLCGYLFNAIKMVWPAWRLYDLFVIVLLYFTWKYALSARNLRVIYDMLERTGKLEADLEASRADAARKRFFLNAVSHDLRTPLNGIVLHADLAALSLADGDRAAAQQSLADIKGCAERAAKLLNAVMELGRVEWRSDAGEAAEVDLMAAIRRLVGDLGAVASSRGLWLRVEGPDSLLVMTNREKIDSILLNLFDNALKFTDNGGVTISAEPHPDRVLVRVADTGIGIDLDDQARIFDEFYQVGNSERDGGRGFGLGLSISHVLARHLGGSLAVESRRGRGSCFTLTLPRCTSDDGSHQPDRGDLRRDAPPGGPAAAPG